MENKRAANLFTKMAAAVVLLCAVLAISFMWAGEDVYAAGTSPTTAETITLGKTVTGTFPAGTNGDAYHYYKFKTKDLKGVQYVLRASNESIEEDVTRRLEYSIIDSDYNDSMDVNVSATLPDGFYSNGTGFIMYLWKTGSTGSMQYTSLKKNSWHYVKIQLDNYGTTSEANTYSFQVIPKKLTNPLKVKAKKLTVKYSKSKTRKYAVTKVISFKNKGIGIRSYKKVSGNKKITVNKKNGKITIKKGLKKGKYTLKVKVTAGGSADYKAGSKTVKITIKVN